MSTVTDKISSISDNEDVYDEIDDFPYYKKETLLRSEHASPLEVTFENNITKISLRTTLSSEYGSKKHFGIMSFVTHSYPVEPRPFQHLTIAPDLSSLMDLEEFDNSKIKPSDKIC